jgi:trehalose 6-phosphate phosphatase
MKPLPPIDDSVALFLDFDGTLADIALRPDAVRLAPDLLSVLNAWHQRLEGALAVVSGRTLAELDAFLAPLRLPLAAEHGAVLRASADATAIRPAAGDADGALAAAVAKVERAARRFAAMHPGLLVERKTTAVALHYRAAPGLSERCLETMRIALHDLPLLELLPGKCVIEARPSDVCKGHAIGTLMGHPPFTGRMPVFAGDDQTDEAGFARVLALGGMAIKVGPGETIAGHRCDSPSALRTWLRQSLGKDESLCS